MNTYAYRALASVVALVVTVVLVLSMSLSSHAGEITCEVSALGNSPNLQVVCYDEDGDKIPPSQVDVSDAVNNIVTVVVNETETIVKEVKVPVPGPTKTVTVRPQPVTVTATATQTNTVALPQETKTVAVPGPTRTVTPQPQPNETVTVTSSPSPTRQAGSEDGTIEADSGLDFSIDFGDGEVSTGEVVLGTLATFLLMGLILLALYAGYVLGWKDKERKEVEFMRAVLDSVKFK